MNRMFSVSMILLAATILLAAGMTGCARSHCCTPAVLTHPLTKEVYLDQPTDPGCIEEKEPVMLVEPYRPEGVDPVKEKKQAEKAAPEKKNKKKKAGA